LERLKYFVWNLEVYERGTGSKANNKINFSYVVCLCNVLYC